MLAEWATILPQTGERHVRLRIHASGLLESWAVPQGPCQQEQRLPEQVRQLVDSFVASARDEGLATDAIAAELRDASKRLGLTADIRAADETSITLHTEQGPIEIRCGALPLLAERFPEAARVQALARLERRFENLQCIVQCGGEAAALKLCAQATRQLQAEHPGEAAWTVSELQMVRVSRDGGRFVQFRRDAAGAECWTTCVMEIPGRAPRVTVLPPARLIR